MTYARGLMSYTVAVISILPGPLTLIQLQQVRQCTSQSKI
jgi:hypothetical protein